jgi:predicted PurR-regulated permease PerM
MTIAIIPLVVAIIVLALLWYVVDRLVDDAKLKQILQVVIVVLCVLWIVGVLTGYGPVLTFR